MIPRTKLSAVLRQYDKANMRIGSLGGHSALDVCRGAKAEGLQTVVVAERGREATYTKHFRTRGRLGCVDHVIVVERFADIVKPRIQDELRSLNTLFVHSRYFWVYCDYRAVENDFLVPILGNRILVKKEERDQPRNQYFLLEQAGIRLPKQFKNPKDIDRLVIVKASEAQRGYERAFFLAAGLDDYQKRSAELIENGTVTAAALKKAVIEEFVVGAQLNLNFFYSPLNGELELLGTDTRRQTNLDGLLRLTVPDQIEVLKHLRPQYIETGHQAVTIKESLLEKAFAAGSAFVKAVAKYYPPGMIGPFALQGGVTPGPPKEELIIFDVSLRMPGSPGSLFTPYSGYLYGENISLGQRLAREVKTAISQDRLIDILT